MINNYKNDKASGKTSLKETKAAVQAQSASSGNPATPAQPAVYRVEIDRSPAIHNITLEEAQKQADDANQLLADLKAVS